MEDSHAANSIDTCVNSAQAIAHGDYMYVQNLAGSYFFFKTF